MGSKRKKPADGSSLYLVRHAKAGERQRWNGDDRKRPLSKRGWKQANRLVRVLEGYPIDRLLTSPYVRCRQTLEPLAADRQLPIEIHGALEEGVGIDGALTLIEQLDGTRAVLCSHGDVIPALIEHFRRNGLDGDGPVESKKGSTWVVETRKNRFVRSLYVPPPA